MSNTTTELALLEQKEVRDSYMERTEVLDKVKALFLLPKLDMMTTQQVAEYYEVPPETVQTCYTRNKDEVSDDGTILGTIAELNFHFERLKTQRGKSVFDIGDGITLEAPNRGMRMFSKRAILRIGMLLRDSEVAKRVRTALLDIAQAVTAEQRIQSIETEQALKMDVGNAVMYGDIKDVLVATTKMIDYKNQHIRALEEANQNLTTANELLARHSGEWEPRKVLSALIRSLACSPCYNGRFDIAWNVFYKELSYAKGIEPKKRGGKDILNTIKVDEWPQLLEVAAALCVKNEIDVGRVINQSNTELYLLEA